MGQLTPVSVILDELSPPGGGSFWTDPSWYDEKTGEPGYTLAEVARFFFARSRPWLNAHLWQEHLVLDGEPVMVPRALNGYHRWRLYDVELTAHALTQGGYLSVRRLQFAIGLVKLVAQNYKYLLVSPIATRVESIYIPEKRTSFMAVETVTRVSDDLDQTPGARTRHFSVGEIHYQIDLVDKNWQEFQEALQRFVAVARPDRRRRMASPEEQLERQRIRIWAQQAGYSIGSRGRIPYAIVDAYKKHQETR